MVDLETVHLPQPKEQIWSGMRFHSLFLEEPSKQNGRAELLVVGFLCESLRGRATDYSAILEEASVTPSQAEWLSSKLHPFLEYTGRQWAAASLPPSPGATCSSRHQHRALR